MYFCAHSYVAAQLAIPLLSAQVIPASRTRRGSRRDARHSDNTRTLSRFQHIWRCRSVHFLYIYPVTRVTCPPHLASPSTIAIDSPTSLTPYVALLAITFSLPAARDATGSLKTYRLCDSLLTAHVSSSCFSHSRHQSTLLSSRSSSPTLIVLSSLHSPRLIVTLDL